MTDGSPRDGVLYVVNAWDGTVSRTDPARGDTVEIDVGGEPTRIASVGGELWVTLRADRDVLVLGPDLAERGRFTVGAEPYGVVASPDGGRVYVALSQEDRVVELSASTRDELRDWDVGDDPRWLAIHPSGAALYVGYAFGPRITRIDLVTGELGDHEAPATTTALGDALPQAGRASGDPAVAPGGDGLAVPFLYVDLVNIGAQPNLYDGHIVPPAVPYYTSNAGSVGRLNPALVLWPLDPATGEVGAGPEPILVVSNDLSGGTSGALASATYEPGGGHVLAAVEGSDAVAVVDLGAEGFEWGSGFGSRLVVHFEVGANPGGVAYTEDADAWVAERGRRTVARLPVQDALDELARPQRLATRTLYATDRAGSGEARLDPRLEVGRALFWSAVDPAVTTPGAGVSCATCHVDGRTDGWTWPFDGNPRQTPSLAGGLSATLPLTWTDAVATIADEAELTSIGRMGGHGLHGGRADDLAAFVDALRPVDNPRRGVEDALVRQGEALFFREDVGCGTCHSGPAFTDNGFHDLGEGPVNTPGLVGVVATPPYLHDGRADTLRAVLDLGLDGTMGSTAHLSDAERDALVAFLESL